MSSGQAAIHLGPHCIENLEEYRNTKFEELQNLFDTTLKLIAKHSEEILNVKQSESASPSRSEIYVVPCSSGQVDRSQSTCLDSVLCLGRCQILQKQTEDGKAKWRTFNCPILTKNIGSRRRTN